MTYEQLIEKIQIQIDIEKDIINGVQQKLPAAYREDPESAEPLIDALVSSRMIIEVLEKLLKE